MKQIYWIFQSRLDIHGIKLLFWELFRAKLYNGGKNNNRQCVKVQTNNRKDFQKYKKNVGVIQLESKKGCSDDKKRWMVKSVSCIKKMLGASVIDTPLINQPLKFESSTFSHISFIEVFVDKEQSLKYSWPCCNKKRTAGKQTKLHLCLPLTLFVFSYQS